MAAGFSFDEASRPRQHKVDEHAGTFDEKERIYNTDCRAGTGCNADDYQKHDGRRGRRYAALVSPRLA